MTASINECTDAIMVILDIALIDSGLANASYDYRTFPDKLYRSYMVHYVQGIPTMSVVAEKQRFYDYAVVLTAQHDKSETGQRDADRDLNDMENAVFTTLSESTNATNWLKILFNIPSSRPRAPIEAPETRISVIPIRLLLR